MQVKRLIWADSLKGVLIILVVLGHAIQETIEDGCFDDHLWNCIYSFHMPAFMAVSGYLSYRGRVNKRKPTLYRRFCQLLVPFFLWSLLKWVLYQNLALNQLPSILLYPDGYFWFLWVLFFIAVFFNFGDWIAVKLKVKQEVIIIGMCLLFVILMVVADVRIMGYQFFAYYFLFYVMGYYLHKYSNLITSKNGVLIILTLLWAVMAWFWKMHEVPSILASVPLPKVLLQYGYRFITAAVAVYVLLAVCPRILNSDNRWNAALVSYGKVSLGIYVVHLLLMPIIVDGLLSCGLNSSVVIALSFATTLPVSWMIVWLLGKWPVTNKLLLGKCK